MYIWRLQNFRDFWPPPPLLVCILDQFIVLNSRNLPYYICFWGTPLSPSHCRHHLYMPPNSVAGGVVGVASVPSHRPSPMTLHFKLAFLCFFVQGVQIGLGQKISLISNWIWWFSYLPSFVTYLFTSSVLQPIVLLDFAKISSSLAFCERLFASAEEGICSIGPPTSEIPNKTFYKIWQTIRCKTVYRG